MSKNLRAIVIKPQNEAVIDILPKNNKIQDIAPKMRNFASSDTEQYYTVILGAGMYMGIPPHTYPTAGTVQTSFSP